MYYVEFGENLKKLRKGRGMTQQELGDRVGVSKAVISKYENATGYPSLDILKRIAISFGVTTDYLLGMSSNNTLDVSGLTPAQIAVLQNLIAVFEEDNRK